MERRSRPGVGTGAAESSGVVGSGHDHDTRPPLSTSCRAGTCPDCHGTGAIGLQPCDRRNHWLRRIGYGDLFGRSAA